MPGVSKTIPVCGLVGEIMFTARDASELSHDFSRRMKTRKELARAIDNKIEEACTRYNSQFKTTFEDESLLDEELLRYILKRLTRNGFLVTVHSSTSPTNTVELSISWT